MHLENLSLINFKNYAEAELAFSSKINCFVGPNGVGKTNLLDAIHYLCMCKSMINTVDSQNVKDQEGFFVVQGNFSKQDTRHALYCGFKKGKKKQFKRNDKEYAKLSEHIGLFPSVVVSPLDANLILDGSEERRKFVDSVISQYNRTYLDALIRYNKALLQRNKLLKNFAAQNQFDESVLEVWNEQLAHYGTLIFKERQTFVEQLIPIFNHYYGHISLEREHVGLTYKSDLHESDMLSLLKERIHKDRVLQYTTVGIHKDDLLLTLKDRPIKKLGSQGQQKSYLVALKLAQFDFLKKVSDLQPLLLLDDVFDKFDRDRVKQIMMLVADNHFGQIFITDTHPDRLEEILEELPIESRLFAIDLAGGIDLRKNYIQANETE